MATVHAALALTESSYISSDSKQHCAGVSIDLKKAFDTGIHKLLIETFILWGKRDRKYLVRELYNEQKTVCCS